MWERNSDDRRTLGAWSFQLRGDEIADLTYRGQRVLRSIRAVVRDRDWNTIPWVVNSDDQHGAEPRGSEPLRDVRAEELALRLRTDSAAVNLSAVLHITASGDAIAVALDAVAGSDFETNRTGLVVLHPPQVAGAVLSVTHTDGSIERTVFPAAISAHQPAHEVAELSWTDEVLAINVRFDGDVFEMEDQRNWTDASFKTYSRPLSLPFPYTLTGGKHVLQSVKVRARQAVGATRSMAREELTLRAAGCFPTLSVGASTAPDPAPSQVVPVGSDLLVEIDLAAPTWRAALARAAASTLPLDVRVVLTDEDTVATLTDAAHALRPYALARVTAFWATGAARHVSDVAAIALLRTALAAAGLSVPVVGGVRSHFTQLNRERCRLPAGLDGIVFSITPLFHTLDTEQALESIAMQRLVATQAVEIAAGTPVHIGPVSLRPHLNDVATLPAPFSPHADLTAGYGPELLGPGDIRQAAPELAAWTIASAAALAVAGVASLSYFEEWGARGIRSAAGDDLPVATAIRTLAMLAGTQLLAADSPDGLLWAVGGVSADGVETILVSNLDRVERTTRISTPSGSSTVLLRPFAWVKLCPTEHRHATTHALRDDHAPTPRA